MEEVGPEALRTLKYNQYWIYFSGLLKLQRQLYRYFLHIMNLRLRRILMPDQ
jgi:hypothetical protein